MNQYWKTLTENVQILFAVGMNLMVAIIYPTYLPIFFPESLTTLNISNPYYASPNFRILKILHFIVVGIYSVYIIFLFIPKLNLVRVFLDGSVIGIQLFIIVRALTYDSYLFLPVDLDYSIAIAFLTLGVATFQLAKYFISKWFIQHKETIIDVGAESID